MYAIALNPLTEILEGQLITHTSSKVSVFAYADDIAIILTSRLKEKHYTHSKVLEVPVSSLQNHKP